MAKVKQPLEENGIHRAKMWEIMMYALNNTSTNTYMMVVGYISYFLIGIVGLASVLAGSIVTIMRIWDGVTFHSVPRGLRLPHREPGDFYVYIMNYPSNFC